VGTDEFPSDAMTWAIVALAVAVAVATAAVAVERTSP
jgi:hypothetical protein